MSFAGQINQLGLALSPVPFLHGPISRQQYLERKDACTKQQLASLLASDEYKAFERRHYRLPAPSRFSEIVLLALALAVFLLLLAGSWTQHGISRQVRAGHHQGVIDQPAGSAFAEVETSSRCDSYQAPVPGVGMSRDLLFTSEKPGLDAPSDAFCLNASSGNVSISGDPMAAVSQPEAPPAVRFAQNGSAGLGNNETAAALDVDPAMVDRAVLPFVEATSVTGVRQAASNPAIVHRAELPFVEAISVTGFWQAAREAGVWMLVLSACYLCTQARHAALVAALQARLQQLQRQVGLSVPKAFAAAREAVLAERAERSAAAADEAWRRGDAAHARAEQLQAVAAQEAGSGREAGASEDAQAALAAECLRISVEAEGLRQRLRMREEALDAAEHQLAALSQDHSLLALRLAAAEEASAAERTQLRVWLDGAQGELQGTQGELREREAELRAARAQACALQERAEAAERLGAELGAEAAAAAGSAAGQVAQVMGMMRSARRALAAKLSQSQSDCGLLAAELGRARQNCGRAASCTLADACTSPAAGMAPGKGDDRGEAPADTACSVREAGEPEACASDKENVEPALPCLQPATPVPAGDGLIERAVSAPLQPIQGDAAAFEAAMNSMRPIMHSGSPFWFARAG